ncbi:MAG: secondary thiamine-phosphate synthase enzyme YjbQ [Deltaproteobacteria bacterium]|nr:secondary thiamine-phosphate synthase enzyme YjbQ [Deltaproteobacteria bacterium]
MDFKISNSSISFKTSEKTDVIDITSHVARKVADAGLTEGQVLIFVPGSTAAVTTIEYESGVVWDFKEAIERFAPTGIPYRHDAKWGDGNGYAHVRASFLGPSLTVPLISGRLALGTWQQIVLVDFNNEPRERKVLITVSGS